MDYRLALKIKLKVKLLSFTQMIESIISKSNKAKEILIQFLSKKLKFKWTRVGLESMILKYSWVRQIFYKIQK